MSSLLSIIIPVYNESKTVVKLVGLVDKISVSKEIIIVDDGSTDGTTDLIKAIKTKSPFKRIYHRMNLGKGAAIKTGLKVAKGKYTVIQDADLEYNPQDLLKMVRYLESNSRNVVYGSRFKLARKGIYSHKIFYAVGQLIGMITNLLYSTRITDEPTCYKMVRTDLLKSLNLECQGFEFCSEVTAKLALRGEYIPEIPISYSPRHINEGKKIKFIDGIIAIKVLIKYKFFNNKSDTMEEGLETMTAAVNYNNWLFSLFKPFIQGNVLEVGSGIGTFTRMISPFCKRVVGLEVNKKYFERLKDNFIKSNVLIRLLDISKKSGVGKLRIKFNLIILINTLEHIFQDRLMLDNLRKLLSKNGKIFIFVPAHQVLYSSWDKSIGHYKRYNKRDFKILCSQAGLKIEKMEYFNIVGFLGWGINKLLGTTPKSKHLRFQVAIYDSLFVPVMRKMEFHKSIPFGQSIYLIASKK